MKIYLASQFARREELAGYAAALTAAGHGVTSRWLWQDTPADGRMDNHGPDDNRRYARQDLEDVAAADALVFFSEDPLVGIPRGARHVEFGYAMARGKAIAVVGPRENIFHWLLPDRAFHADFAAFLTALSNDEFACFHSFTSRRFPFRHGDRIQHASGEGDTFIVRTVDDHAQEVYAERAAPAVGPGTRVLNPGNWKKVEAPHGVR